MVQANTLRALCGLSIVVAAFALTGCAQQGQNRYNHDEVGKSVRVEFGTVVNVRVIDITGENTKLGAAAGAAGGGIAGSQIGSGAGNSAAILGGVLIGAAAGYLAEQAMADRKGHEYVVALENGKVITIVQEIKPEDRVFAPGNRVMVQAAGTYQRVLPTDSIPTEMDRPKGIKYRD